MWMIHFFYLYHYIFGGLTCGCLDDYVYMSQLNRLATSLRSLTTPYESGRNVCSDPTQHHTRNVCSDPTQHHTLSYNRWVDKRWRACDRSISGFDRVIAWLTR